MGESTTPETGERAVVRERYDVVLLVEQPLSDLDARQVFGLHEGVDADVVYHVLMPVEDSAQRIESSLGGLAGGEMLMVPSTVLAETDLEGLRQDILDEARRNLQRTLDALGACGATAVGQTISADPIEGLAAKVAEVDAREAIILTRPHVVAEFFHVDWTSRARRKLGVPVLHLLEHETFDEQAGEGEGISGF